MKSCSEIAKVEVRDILTKQFNYKNIHEIPQITKITISRGVGESLNNNKALDISVDEFKVIIGRAPVITNAKKAIAGFKLREGAPIGLKVTLRKKAMYSFIDKLIHLAFPRIKDFRGINKSGFDGRGNFNIGFTEQIAFPEIEYDKIDKIRGLNIAISTTAKTDEEGLALLQALGLPFKQ
uniref:Large ribosomal subunit protein uL5c n=2 Tax=Pavlovaceae TaxID=418969 RepID=M1KFP6_DIALT|nr:ribosomal protein L5 [Diacronema lutheri]YP_009863757.1 ribosomal protein L5 [Pavlova sp. NIVA-4/92]AGE93735.1 ribosomal protein L5 [Diacronema lutheri]QKE31088.1 ribosomal protein L5 [Pavlova sp. NIVA-4/92]|mmetsp:Transcript_11229/g.35448  ORF Transcript_11229/g.35448 Transcript_11229/m.35448 type:complete len:180 (+) Transcript_11229:4638-5177(+)